MITNSKKFSRFSEKNLVSYIQVLPNIKMKRTIFIFALFLTSFQMFSQQLECACDSMEIAEENRYKCEIQNFQNGSQLYWQWNCDSSWLTFENKEKVILKSCENETVYGCQRAGLGFLKEYKNYLLFQYEWISGCCASPDMVFINKETGKEIKRIPHEQFVWGDIEKDYLLYFSDSTFTSLILLDHLTDKKINLNLPLNKLIIL
ncbi:hypothetical protein V8V91_25460 [Algoriphagus halophilus]|uniref:hypothetical protein n=1 Tax=Algoriphagus halophilus TaxID=226505 RepID=UPI00358FB6D9